LVLADSDTPNGLLTPVLQRTHDNRVEGRDGFVNERLVDRHGSSLWRREWRRGSAVDGHMSGGGRAKLLVGGLQVV
jgi:hypothetical protein